MSTRVQQDTSASALTALSSCVAFGNRTGSHCLMLTSGAAGSLSRSVNALSASFNNQIFGSFITVAGDPGTADWTGACTMRWNITTANTNFTWSELVWTAYSASAPHRLCVTRTSGLAIGLGTTGVKTASVEATGFVALTTDVVKLIMAGSNAALMAAAFVCVYDQTVDVPFSASAAPATTAIPSLTLLNNGR